MGDGGRVRRPFWIHQIVEYLIGLILVVQGLQAPDPLIPSLAGVAVLVNVAIVRGPLGAFRIVGKSMHRRLDALVVVVLIVAALQPWVSIDSTGRVMIGLAGLMLGVVLALTDYSDVPAVSITGERIGRSAGRWAGVVAGQVRARQRNRATGSPPEGEPGQSSGSPT